MENVLIIGLGGGAQSIINMINNRIDNVKTLVIDSDELSLKTASSKTILFPNAKDEKSTGCSGDVELGKKLAEKYCHRLKKDLENINLVYLIACLGGGFATGSCPIIAHFLNNIGIKVKILLTLPFQFEGKRRTQSAIDCVENIEQNFKGVKVLSNDKLLDKLDKQCNLKDAFAIIDKEIFKIIKDKILVTGMLFFSVLNGDLSLTDELEIKNFADKYKNLTIESMLIKLVVNESVTLNNSAGIFEKISKYFNENLKIVFSMNVDENLPKTTSYITIKLSSDKNAFDET